MKFDERVRLRRQTASLMRTWDNTPHENKINSFSINTHARTVYITLILDKPLFSIHFLNQHIFIHLISVLYEIVLLERVTMCVYTFLNVYYI